MGSPLDQVCPAYFAFLQTCLSLLSKASKISTGERLMGKVVLLYILELEVITCSLSGLVFLSSISYFFFFFFLGMV